MNKNIEIDYKELFGNNFDKSLYTEEELNTRVKNKLLALTTIYENILLFEATAEQRETLFKNVVGEQPDGKYYTHILFGSLNDLTPFEYNENLKEIEYHLTDMGFDI